MTVKNTVNPEKVAAALEAAGQALFEFHLDTNCLVWSDLGAARNVMGFAPEEDPADVDALLSNINEDSLMAREAALRAAASDETSYNVEYAVRDRWIEERGTFIEVGGRRMIIGLVRCVDEQKRREQELHYLARYDELTGQLNRTRFKEELTEAAEAIAAGTRSGSLLLAGIDDVGGINNAFGFDIADQVIVEVAGRISTVLKGRASLGRVAGTKFGILLNDGSPEEMRDVARLIMNSMRSDVVMTRAGGIAVSVCIGAVGIEPEVAGSVSEVMAKAEAAFDEARRSGPSSFELFTDKTERISRRRQNTALSDVILTALNDRRIYLAYQPIVADMTAEVKKFECLVRMCDEDGVEYPAPQFVPAAEQLGLVHLLDRRVLELATGVLHERTDIQLAVNLSWETVRDPVWAEGYLSHLRANARVTDRLTIELTETQMVDAIESSVEFVSAIKEFGCKFALDDFGAGYTSFRNLKALDIDILKIDGSFVTGVSTNRENQTFVRTLLDLARNFRLQTVAEWVDNEQDAQLLKALGVDWLQGYLLGKPAALPPLKSEEGQAGDETSETSGGYDVDEMLSPHRHSA